MTPLTASFTNMFHAAGEMALGVALIFTMAAVGHCGTGCLPAVSSAEVDAAYRAETVGCSVSAKTLEEAKECRREVNKRYGLCERAEWPRLTPCDD